MGNQNTAAPNQVDIMQERGCAKCSPSAPRFETENIDPRLEPYITKEQYKSALEEANQIFEKKVPRALVWWVLGIVGAIIGGVILAFRTDDANICEAPNGDCREGQDPDADQCCRYRCCLNARRLAAPDDPFNSSELELSNAPVPDVRAARALLSPRRLQQPPKRLLTTSSNRCEDWEATTDTQCMCEQRGKHRHCSGRVSVEGLHRLEPGRFWPLVVGGGVFGTWWILPGAVSMYAQCSMAQWIEPALQPWRQSGLQVRYHPGSKGYQARISVFTPSQPPTVVGSPTVLNNMKVTVPAGAPPGTMLQFTTPQGKTLQAPVPEGVVEGGTFVIAY